MALANQGSNKAMAKNKSISKALTKVKSGNQWQILIMD